MHQLRHLVAILFIPLIASSQTPGFLQLVTTQGEGSFNDIKGHMGHPPVVQVKDEDNNPVEGAEVKFLLPAIGPSGTFKDGGRTYTTTTNVQGLASASEFTPNSEEGRFNIKVTASFQGKTGSLVVAQSNTLAGGGSLEQRPSNRGKKIAILVAIVGGAAGAAAALGHGGSHSSAAAAAPTSTLNFGGIAVGGPH